MAACGRVGFDPTAGNGNDGKPPPAGDGGSPVTHDATLGDGASPMIDAQASACANALVVQSGVKLTTSTCVGADLIDGCGPPNTQEVVFAFSVPTTGPYLAEAFDTGTNNVSNSTAMLDSTCTQTTGTCAGLLGVNLTKGDTAYFIVEADAGGCATIDFSIVFEN